MSKIPDVPLPRGWKGHAYLGPPVLFGHYWFTETPTVISPKFACLDYSAARGGPLVAYRWDGETALKSENLAWVSSHLRFRFSTGTDNGLKEIFGRNLGSGRESRP